MQIEGCEATGEPSGAAQIEQHQEGEDWLSSDEEKNILQEIKEEIKSKVRSDMQGELSQYNLNNLSSRTESVASSRSAAALEGVRNILPQRDIKYQEAYEKMKKLDKLLRKKMATERQVKRERALLEKRIKEELDHLQESHSSRRSKDEMTNTMKFLALTPSSQQEAESLKDEYSEPHTPVFPTEYLFDDRDDASVGEDTGENLSEQGRRASDGCVAGGTSRKDGRKRAGKQKDFLKRNIELAAAANEVVAMTPEERERLDALLRDLGSVPELPEELLDTPGHLEVVTPGEGFRVSEQQEQRLREIDSSLAQLGSAPPPTSSRLLSSSKWDKSSFSVAYRPSALLQMHLEGGDDWALEIDKVGEKALAEVREERLMDQRLQELDQSLSALSKKSSDAPLSADQLSALLSDCAQSITHSQLSSCRDQHSQLQSEADESDFESDPTLSSRSPLPAVPQLQQSVVDRLLAEARAEGIGQNWQRPDPIVEESEDEDERLVLPDIRLFANMSAPKSATSGSYSAN